MSSCHLAIPRSHKLSHASSALLGSCSAEDQEGFLKLEGGDLLKLTTVGLCRSHQFHERTNAAEKERRSKEINLWNCGKKQRALPSLLTSRQLGGKVQQSSCKSAAWHTTRRDSNAWQGFQPSGNHHQQRPEGRGSAERCERLSRKGQVVARTAAEGWARRWDGVGTVSQRKLRAADRLRSSPSSPSIPAYLHHYYMVRDTFPHSSTFSASANYSKQRRLGARWRQKSFCFPPAQGPRA